jgi:hypothetical protein
LISARLGSGQAAFAASHSTSGYRLAGGGVAADLGARGVRFSGAAGWLSMALSASGRGAGLRAVGSALPVARSNRVTYAHPGLQEWYAAGPLGIEQGFTVDRRPAGARGRLTLALRIRGSLHARLTGSELRFVTPAGRVVLRYGGLSAVDVTGRVLPASFVLRGHSLVLSVADRRAHYPVRIDPFIQQGPVLTPSDAAGAGDFGFSAALSPDGSTALVGAPNDNSFHGAAWVFTRSNGVWAQQGLKLTPNDAIGQAGFGVSVALSADGTTALIGGDSDNAVVGAAWAFTNSGATWTQQGPKLTPNDGTNQPEFGSGVALSADGNTALIGGDDDDQGVGAAWVFTRSVGVWTQQGGKHTPTSGAVGGGGFGAGVALSADGITALIGAPGDNNGVGAAWVFTRPAGIWAQQGPKLAASDETGAGQFGASVALSADGNTAVTGGPDDDSSIGAAWLFDRSNSVWTQQGFRLTGSGEVGAGQFGSHVAISADGSIVLIGAPDDRGNIGAAWVFTPIKGVGNQSGSEITAYSGEIGSGGFGAVALSSYGDTALIGGPLNNGGAGAAWVFTAPGQISGPSSLSFGSQTTTQAGAVQWLPVANSGQGTVRFTGPAQIGGADAADFSIPNGEDLCVGQALAPDQECWIGVQFTAAATGSRSATLSYGANNLPSSPTVTLSGTGIAPNAGSTGPTGVPGAAGSSGATGSPGANGTNGTNGAPGPRGPAGQIELITCVSSAKTVKVHGKPKKTTQKTCTTKIVSSPVKFTMAIARARLSRGRVTYATGTAILRHGTQRLLLHALRPLRAKHYTLTLTQRHGKHAITTHTTITMS